MEETRKYKQTELGLLPEDWEVVKLGDCLSIGNGKDYKHLKEGNIPVYGTGGIMCYVNDFLYDGTTVCIGRKGTIDAPIYHEGTIWTVDTLFYTHSFVGLIERYAYYLFNQINWQSHNEATGVPSLSKVNILSIEIARPPIKEQRRIASALTSIDNLIDSLDRLIAKKRDMKQGAMQQLLSGKKRLKGFTEPWKIYKIDDLFDIGNGYTPSKANSAYWTNGTIPWFRMEDIRANGRILKDSIQHITEEAVKNSGLFPANSIILSTTATIGEHALLIADSLANQRFSFLIRKLNRCSDIDIMFFFYYCFILGEWCRANINDGGLMAVNMTDLKNYTFSAPSLPEQQAIASVLTSIDNELSALEAKRKKYEQIKQGMMQQLLTGKIRLENASIVH